jgi:hypothetical protein
MGHVVNSHAMHGRVPARFARVRKAMHPYDQLQIGERHACRQEIDNP